MNTQPEMPKNVCTTCRSTSEMRHTLTKFNDGFTVDKNCPDCMGTGALPEQAKALPEVETEPLPQCPFCGKADDFTVGCDGLKEASARAGKDSAVSVKVLTCVSELVEESVYPIDGAKVTEIILRHLTDESDEVVRLREALKRVRFYYEDWEADCDLPKDWPRRKNGKGLSGREIIDAALQNKSEGL